ncbi:methylthioribulose 1-phosphate dehydratase [Metabacillus sp. 84]|uniref:methylthioribulose 1-phosphate dehydratase n=1 Tax=unclassified Metabacillus TaxID=2675274 RepID=UPI003CE7E628
MSQKEKQPLKELALIKRELAERDWFPATSGNLAIRTGNDPLAFYVTASGKDKREETDDDFLLVNEHGEPAGETHLKPSAETLLHLEIFKKTHAACSLHVHTVDNNVISEIFANEGMVTFTNQEIIKAFGLWEENASFSVPIIPNHADIPALAKAFGVHVHKDAGAVLIRNHGITVWGRTALEAKKYLEACEFLFSYHVKLLQCRVNQSIKL